MINVTQTFLPPLEEYTAQLQRVWDSKWLTNRGELVRELEDELKKYLGINSMLIVNNGTIALQLAIKALDLSGEIITTPFSYVATVSSIVWEGCEPVFVDIDADFLTIDETKIEAAITEKTSAILATHVYGNPCNVEAIKAIADKHNLKVIYDAAHCFGVQYKGESVLNWGDVSTLSFHATKLFHTGEGGGVVCPDAELAHRIFYMHNFGHNGQEEFWGLGINAKTSELQAAMGLCVLPHINEIIAHRQSSSQLYDELLAQTSLTRPLLREETEYNFAYYPVLFETEQSLLQTKDALNKQEIFPRRYFYPGLDRLPYVEPCSVPVSTDASARVLCLPLSDALTVLDVERICLIIKESL
ncbi:MAG: DegT/DnrJ/EryC1/StrS family aminotransferase [Pyrinomonadaceae bacterium]|nr:DegT/DnrJ/EryC1/StrS family aminotransferase [Pyrinomonadaceae bacterium]